MPLKRRVEGNRDLSLAQYKEIESLGVSREQIKALEVLVGLTAPTQVDLARTETVLRSEVKEIHPGVQAIRSDVREVRWRLRVWYPFIVGVLVIILVFVLKIFQQ